jgi:hypothetical protein
VKEERPKIVNNSGSTLGLSQKRYREKKRAVPSIPELYPYVLSVDLAIEYFKAVGVIKSLVNEQCEVLIPRKPGRAGSNPLPKRCPGTLVERTFHNKDGEGDPRYRCFYRCTSCGGNEDLLKNGILHPARLHLHLFLLEMILILQQTPSASIERLTGLSDKTVLRDR